MIDSGTFSCDARLRRIERRWCTGGRGVCASGEMRGVQGMGKLRSIMHKPQRAETQSHPCSGLIHQPRSV